MRGANIVNIYSVRYSVNRKIEYQIKTVIYEENGIVSVKKEPYTKYANNHILNICRNYELLKNSSMKLVIPKIKENAVVFPFINGESLDAKLIFDVNNGDIDSFKSRIKKFKKIIENDEVIKFSITDKFEKIFGDGYNFDGLYSLKISNIDSNFDNLIIDDNNEITVIDYEWVFDFPIPLDFVFYRSISSFISKYQLPQKFLLAIEEIFSDLDISKEMLIYFDEMEQHFTTYIGHNTQMYANYLKDIAVYKNSNDIHLFEQGTNGYFQLFWSSDDTYSENQSVKINLIQENQKQIFEIELPEDPINYLRIDPTTFIGDIDIQGNVIGEEDSNLFDFVVGTTDCIIKKDQNSFNWKIISGSTDPQIYIKHPNLYKTGPKKIKIELMYHYDIEQNLSMIFNTKNQEIKDLKHENAEITKKNKLIKKELQDVIKLKKQLNSEITAINNNIVELNTIIQEKERLIHQIITSRAWRILKKLRLVKI